MNKNNKSSRRQNTKDFMRGFFTTLSVFLPLCAAIYFMSAPIQNTTNPISQSVDEPVNDVPVKATKSYNLLWILSDSETHNLQSVTLLRFDVDHYRIVVCNIPHTTVMLDAKAPVDLFTLYEQRGALGVRNAVEQTLSIPISGYISLKTDDLVKAVDTLGDFGFTLDKELSVTSFEGLVTFSKPAGTSQFSGNDVAQLIIYGNYINEERTWLHEKLWQSALQQYADDTFAEKLSQLYSALVNTIETDINAASIYSFALVVKTVCPQGGAQIEMVRPNGNFNDLKYELAQGADEQLWTYFSKLQ